MRLWFGLALWQKITIALVLGVIVGIAWGEGAAQIKWIGDIFIRLIRMIVVPLIFLTLVSGIIAMGDPKKLGSLGIKTLGLYIGTTAVAISIGLILAAILQPGNGVDISGAVAQNLPPAKPLLERLIAIVPTNPIQALAEADILAVIFFAVMFGVGILLAGEAAKPLVNLFEAGSEVMLKITHIVMEVAPFGVFALIAWVSGTKGVTALLDVLTLAAAIFVGCIAHILIMHGGLVKGVVGYSPLTFFNRIRSAQLVAFSTSSSSATLPVTLATAEERVGIKPVVASSVLPLGATINMDGTALYVGIVAVFAAQVFGIDLAFTDYLLIALTTTLVSIGTAAVPSASLFLLAAVLGVLGISADQTALIVGFLLPFDRPLDMMRTVVNVTGDLAVASSVAKWEDELDSDVFNNPGELDRV